MNFTDIISNENQDFPIKAHWGYIGLSVAVVFYGSNYLPVKQFETGDGMFFQLILAIGIWIVGFFVNCARNFPKFYALPMLGGALWTTGNVNTVPSIKCIGIGLGMLIW
jgi:glucose uptake protein GlcU